eukprot:6485402-Amphidinium_carterae.1
MDTPSRNSRSSEWDRERETTLEAVRKDARALRCASKSCKKDRKIVQLSGASGRHFRGLPRVAKVIAT